MKNLRYYSRTLTKEKNMQVKIQELAGEFVDDELHSDLVTIMKENSDEVHQRFQIYFGKNSWSLLL